MRRTGTSLLVPALIVSLAAACSADHPVDPDAGPGARPAFQGGWVGGGGRLPEDSTSSSGTVQGADTTAVSTTDSGGWVGGGGD